MAQIAGHVGVAIRQRETGRAVIKNPSRPGCNRVARGAGGSRDRKARSHVIWNFPTYRRGALESRLVAAITVGRTERVIIVHVAGSAGRRRRRNMRSSQSKARRAVIERRSRPANRRVAGGAVRCGKCGARRGMNRIIRLLPCRQMASRVPAVSRCDHQVVIVIDVARCAGHAGMAVGQHEPGLAVVKLSGRGPTGRVMARLAIGKGELRSRRWMRRIVRLLPNRQMATRVPAIA